MAITIEENLFDNNSAVFGGAISVSSGNIYSTSDHAVHKQQCYLRWWSNLCQVWQYLYWVLVTSTVVVNHILNHTLCIYMYVYSGNINSTSDQYLNNTLQQC